MSVSRSAVRVSLVGLSVGVSAVAPAPAAADHIGCESGNACIWAGTSWQTDGVHGRHLHFQSHIPDFNDWYYGEQHPIVGLSSYTAWGNASSMSNNRNEYVHFFAANNCSSGDGEWIWAPITGDKNLSNGPSGSNNAFKSGAFARALSTCRS